MKMRTVRSQKGFSLIELMIVVAIIGILATIAIPNFNRFQAKARQSEAKTNLAAIYAAEKAFYAEWTTYFGNFADIGFQPSGRLTYSTGFAATGAQPPAPFQPVAGGGGAGNCFNSAGAGCPANFMIWQNVAGQPAFALGAVGCGQIAANSVSPPTAVGFRAGAVGNLMNSGTNDTWTINADNVMCNIVPGI